MDNDLVLHDIVDVLDELEERGQYSWVDIRTKEGCKFRITVAQNSLSVKNLHEGQDDLGPCAKEKSFVGERPVVVQYMPQYVEVLGKSRDDGKSNFAKAKYSSWRKQK